MPTLTDKLYGSGRGRSNLSIVPNDGYGWDDFFELMVANPRRFVTFRTDEFIGTNGDGESTTPGRSVILKTFHKEALRRGLVIGEQLPKTELLTFSAAYRGTLDEVKAKSGKLPQKYRDWLKDGTMMVENASE